MVGRGRVTVVGLALVLCGTGAAAQSPAETAPQAPATSLRSAPAEGDRSGWQAKLPWAESEEEARTPRFRGHFYQQEYLARVAPDAFRRSALSAAPAVGSDPGQALRFLKDKWRARQQRRFDAEVTRELDRLGLTGEAPPDEP